MSYTYQTIANGTCMDSRGGIVTATSKLQSKKIWIKNSHCKGGGYWQNRETGEPSGSLGHAAFGAVAGSVPILGTIAGAKSGYHAHGIAGAIGGGLVGGIPVVGCAIGAVRGWNANRRNMEEGHARAKKESHHATPLEVAQKSGKTAKILPVGKPVNVTTPKKMK